MRVLTRRGSQRSISILPYAGLKSGDGIVGALLNGDGLRFDTNLQASAASARSAMETLDSLVQRYHNADGTIPQLMENRKYASDVMSNLLQSSADLQQILRKINTGQGR